jgi:hypothetical protein
MTKFLRLIFFDLNIESHFDIFRYIMPKNPERRIPSQRSAYEAMNSSNLTEAKAWEIVRFYLTDIKTITNVKAVLDKYIKGGNFKDKFDDLSQREEGLIYAALECLRIQNCGQTESATRRQRREGKKKSRARGRS